MTLNSFVRGRAIQIFCGRLKTRTALFNAAQFRASTLASVYPPPPPPPLCHIKLSRCGLRSLFLLALIIVCGQAQAQTNTAVAGEPAVTAADGTDLTTNGPNVNSVLTATTGTIADADGAIVWQWQEVEVATTGTAKEVYDGFTAWFSSPNTILATAAMAYRDAFVSYLLRDDDYYETHSLGALANDASGQVFASGGALFEVVEQASGVNRSPCVGSGNIFRKTYTHCLFSQIPQMPDVTNIPGATAEAFAPMQAQAGKFLRVCVAFDDDAGNSETRCWTSVAKVNAVASGEPAVTAADGADLTMDGPNVGSTLTASIGTIDDANDITAFAPVWQWQEVETATVSTATLTGTAKEIYDGIVAARDAQTHQGLMDIGDAVLTAFVSYLVRDENYGDMLDAVQQIFDGLQTSGPSRSLATHMFNEIDENLVCIGNTDSTYRQFVECLFARAPQLPDDITNIPGAASATFAPMQGQAGKLLRVCAAFDDDDGGSEMRCWTSVAPVVRANIRLRLRLFLEGPLR